MNIEYPISNVEGRRLRKYIYGPGIDQPATRTAGKPACMIELAGANHPNPYMFTRGSA